MEFSTIRGTSAAFASFNLHDPMVVEPGLVRIGMDYGWMRAADVVEMPQNAYARELSDRITLLRVENWRLAHWAAGARFLDPHRGFTDLVFADISVPANSGIQPVPDPDAVREIRDNCRQIRGLVEQRLLTCMSTPPAARTAWFTQWEATAVAPPSANPWADFYSHAGDVLAETPPAAL